MQLCCCISTATGCNEDFEDNIRSRPTTRSDKSQLVLNENGYWQLSGASALLLQQVCHCGNSSESYIKGAVLQQTVTVGTVTASMITHY